MAWIGPGKAATGASPRWWSCPRGPEAGEPVPLEPFCQIARLRSTLDELSVAVVRFGADRTISFANRAFCRWAALRPEMLIGRDVLGFGHPEMTVLLRDALAGLSPAAPRASFSVELTPDEGAPRHEEWQVLALHDGRGRLVEHQAVGHDITEQRRIEERVRHLAEIDLLTGLPNRRLLSQRLGEALVLAGESGRGVALLCLDLDDFKSVNDTLGLAAGDELLRQVAARLQAVAGEGVTVARLGSDEFVLLQGEAEGRAQALALARRVVRALQRPVQVFSHGLHVSASIGVAVAPEDASTSAELLRQADLALWHAKRDGRRSVRLFRRAMQEELQERKAIERELRVALMRGEFQLVYQPQVALDTGRTVGLEVLLRWVHPQRGLIPPSKFVPIAEETGLIVAIGEWVLRKGLSQMRRWDAVGLPRVRLAVNLSPLEFARAHLVERVREILTASRVSPDRLELEITEGTLMHNTERSVRTMRLLRKSGVSLAVDDFGTGYSSLGYLKSFPIDRIKIDRSFVRQLPHAAGDGAIARAILGLGRNLGLKVLAEGVENVVQRDFLQREGCDEVQGYLFARPLPPEAVPAYLTAGEAPGEAGSAAPGGRCQSPFDLGPGVAIQHGQRGHGGEERDELCARQKARTARRAATSSRSAGPRPS
jgi:diguanylate cyclase (GGDEF)-like protein/PAS domain S-box-containing protein